MAALGLNPVVYLRADPTLETALSLVLVRALEIQQEWRQDLAVRIINQLGKSMRGS